MRKKAVSVLGDFNLIWQGTHSGIKKKVYTHTHTHTHTYTHIHTHTHIYRHTHTHIHTHIPYHIYLMSYIKDNKLAVTF